MSHTVTVSPENKARDEKFLADREASGVTRYIQRHSLQARITHDCTIIICIWLMLSGVVVFAPPVTQALGPQVVWVCRMSHRIFGVLFCAIPLISFFLAPKGARRIWQNNICKWTSDDKLWMLLFFPYLFGAKWIHMPDQDEQKSGQRVADGALWVFGFLMGVTGLVLTLGTTFITMDAGTHAFWLCLHDLGFFGLCIFVPAHIWLGAGIFQPYRGSHRLMFGDGQVSESDALYHWGHWAREELANGKNVVYRDNADGHVLTDAELRQKGLVK